MMKWTTRTSTMFPGLMNVYDEDGNSVVRDKIPEHARLIAAAPDMLEALLFIQSLAKNPDHRTMRTQIQMCNFFDELILPAIEQAFAQAFKDGDDEIVHRFCSRLAKEG